MISESTINKLEKDYGLTNEMINKSISQSETEAKFKVGDKQIDASDEIKKLMGNTFEKLANRPKGKHRKKWYYECIKGYLGNSVNVLDKAYTDEIVGSYLKAEDVCGETREFVIGGNENDC